MSQVTDRPVLDAFEAIELALIANGGSIKGRTALQKIVYFIAVRVPDNAIGYKPHFFGPYSVDVATGLADLRSLGHVYEITIPAGRHTAYEYGITNYGRDDAKRVEGMYPKETCAKIKDVVTICRDDLKTVNSPRLLYASKVHYVLENHGRCQLPKPQNDGEICDVARRFGWGLTVDNVELGSTLLRELDVGP